MKTTIELDDELFRRTKAEAALRGQTLKGFFDAALREYLRETPARHAAARGWRSVFGQAEGDDVARVDAVVCKEFERIDPEAWK